MTGLILTGVVGSVLVEIIMRGVKAGAKNLPDVIPGGRTREFESVSEFWYVGMGIDPMCVGKEAQLMDVPKKVAIRGHISPFAPVIPGSPLDSLGMDPRVETDLSITDRGAGARLDGMDILWNDQVFLPPGRAGGEDGFYYAGLYDRFGDADVHIPLYMDKHTKNLDGFLRLCEKKRHGSVAIVKGRPFTMDRRDLDRRLYNVSPEIREINKRFDSLRKRLGLPHRNLVALQVTSIEARSGPRCNFLGTLWLSQRGQRKRRRERIIGRYLNIGSPWLRGIVDREFRDIYKKSPSSVSLCYDDDILPGCPEGNVILRDRWADLR